MVNETDPSVSFFFILPSANFGIEVVDTDVPFVILAPAEPVEESPNFKPKRAPVQKGNVVTGNLR